VAYAVREEAFSGDAAIENTVNVEDLKQEFLSLQKLKAFKNIYPGHDRMPLNRQDIEALEAHFVDRLDDVLGACRDGATPEADSREDVLRNGPRSERHKDDIPNKADVGISALP
jgi:hypothetical protein